MQDVIEFFVFIPILILIYTIFRFLKERKF